ncbi:MAG: hydrolase [Novosphingobium pentaromativorans]|uniref:Hydrolase n=1 Tax=Novosphingobium pentaromativorans TaxID=205844 RepID=A0A2W5QGV3_9SPHN|nr:MAG: hydrolase [Novosphingobium pentaromativorans]
MIPNAFGRIAVFLLSASLVVPAQAQDVKPAQTETVFRNVRVFDGHSGRLSAPTSVTVKGNVIAAIGPGSSTSSGAHVIDGKGRTLMPGMIDVHVHLTFSALTEPQLLSPDLTPQSAEVAAAVQAKAMLLRGFTAVRDMGGPIFGLKAGIDAGKYQGPRIWPSGAVISQTSGHGDFRLPSERSRRFFGKPARAEELGATFIADGRDEVLTATRENLRFGASQIKLMAGGGSSSEYDPLDVTQYLPEELSAAVAAAQDWGTYVAVHAYTPRAVRRALDAGVQSIEHGQLLDEATIKLIGERGAWLSLQNLPPPLPGDPPERRAKKMEVREGSDHAWAWAKKYHLKLAWGTDFLFRPEENREQNAYILKLKQWFAPAEILKMVTYDNAQLLALSGERSPYKGKLGVVEVGALADLILVDGDPISDIDLIADPEKNFVAIMKDGVFVRDPASK